MANPENLVNLKDRTKTEQREIARKGGIKSGEVRRQRKTLAQIGDMIGNLDIKSEKNREILRQAGIADEDMINDVGMLFRLNMKAQQGDVGAAKLLAQLRGELKQDTPFGSAEISSITINFGGKKTVNGEEE